MPRSGISTPFKGRISSSFGDWNDEYVIEGKRRFTFISKAGATTLHLYTTEYSWRGTCIKQGTFYGGMCSNDRAWPSHRAGATCPREPTHTASEEAFSQRQILRALERDQGTCLVVFFYRKLLYSIAPLC